MTAPMNTDDTASEQDIAARLAAAEAAIAASERRRAIDVERVNRPLEPRPTPHWASASMERQERQRQARLRAAAMDADIARSQAITDAPKQAKRDKALAALTEQIGAVVAEQQALERKYGELMRERASLAGRPL